MAARYFRKHAEDAGVSSSVISLVLALFRAKNIKKYIKKDTHALRAFSYFRLQVFHRGWENERANNGEKANNWKMCMDFGTCLSELYLCQR